MLITHRGLSGPAILQISSYWSAGEDLRIDLAPDHKIANALQESPARGAAARTILQGILPRRFANRWLELHTPSSWANRAIETWENELHEWVIRPVDTEGYEKAEVTAGGVSTNDLSSKTMGAKEVPGLFFIGEAVDVTGQLGGFNFQWAWASGAAAGRSL
jgi:hypothetical protein